MCQEKSLKWVDGKVKALGVWLCTDENYQNGPYEDKFHTVEDTLSNWQNKRLTLPKKIKIIKKTLAAPQLV